MRRNCNNIAQCLPILCHGRGYGIDAAAVISARSQDFLSSLFRKAFLLRHFEEMEPLLDERQKAVAQDFVERHLTDAPPPPPDENGPR